jgi:DNA-directed RNA polymerase I subunit RPA49
MAEKEGKKRKRVSNGAESSNKRVAIPPPNARLTKVTFNHPNGPHPVLVSSPGLNVPRIPFKAYSKPRSTKQSNNEAPKPSAHSLFLHSSEHPRLDYIATPNTLDQGLSHYVAVFDPAKNELQITPAHHLNLRSTLRLETAEQEKQPRRTLGQQREALGREFGTKKAKKALDDKTVNALVGRGSGDKQMTTSDVQSAILDSMGTPGGPAAVDEREALATSLASKPIPKPNLDAETVDEVYDLKILMPPQDAKLISIKEWLDDVKDDGKDGDEKKFNRAFLKKRVQDLAKRDDIVRLRALKYLHLLLDFHAALTPAGQGKKVPKKEVMERKMSSWPETLVSNIRHRFANQSNELPKFYLERLYTHICALALYVDGFVTDTKDLREDLKLEQKEIVQYFRELGCKISAPTEKEREARKIKTKAEAGLMKIAKLKLPLEFPKPRAGRR